MDYLILCRTWDFFTTIVLLVMVDLRKLGTMHNILGGNQIFLSHDMFIMKDIWLKLNRLGMVIMKFSQFSYFSVVIFGGFSRPVHFKTTQNNMP